MLFRSGLAGVRVRARILLAVAGVSSIGIALSPEPVVGSTPQHLAWTALGAVAITVWPAFVARSAPPRPLILSSYGCAVVTAVGLAGVRVRARILLAVAGLSSIGIAVSPEPARGSTPQHLAWTALGAVAIAVWPALVARRAPPRPLILSNYGRAVVTGVFIALLGWLVIETQAGSDLGLAERLFLSIETCWPFVVAVTLRRQTAKTVSELTGQWH